MSEHPSSGSATEPQWATESERVVYEALRAQLEPGEVLLPGQWLTDAQGDHEADLILLVPDHGVVVIEVKGGRVKVDGNGQWRLVDGYGERGIDPVGQARRTKYAFRAYVEGDERWSRGRIRWHHAVVVPHTPLADDFSVPECPRWLIHGAGDLATLRDRLASAPAADESAHRRPTADDLDLLREILTGRLLPDGGWRALAAEHEERAARLSEEQALLLRATRLLTRVEVRGGAGSGKTVLALAQAKERCRRERVALLCYSIGLAEFFKREVATWPKRHRPGFVGTWEELGRSWGASGGTRQDSAFWETTLPQTMLELAGQLEPGRRFDAIIVDEAQDFAQTWWAPLLAALKSEEDGGLFVYSDEKQRLFPRFGRPPVALVPLVLDTNLRNTRQIHRAFEPLAPEMRERGCDGHAVHVEPLPGATPDEVVERADELVDQLIDAGYEPGDIALVTTGSRHPVHVERFDEADPCAYWESFWDGEDVFYGHVLGVKGLERRVVVLALNELPGHVRDRAGERLYVGMSRATDRLVVVGDPAVIREMGGDAVARRLGLT